MKNYLQELLMTLFLIVMSFFNMNLKAQCEAIIFSSTPELCTNDVALLDASASTGTMPFTYMWNTFETTSSIYTPIPGEYTVTITDSNGCEAIASYYLLEAPYLEAIITSNTTELTCTSPSILLDGSASINGSGGIVYNWPTGETTASITVQASGTYSLEIIDINGCFSFTTINITGNGTEPTAIITASAPTLACPGDIVYLDASSSSGQGSLTYEWSTGETTAMISAFYSGDYTVTVTDTASGCAAIAVYTLVEELPPYADIQANSTELNCFNTNILLDGTGSFTSSGMMDYYWSTGETTALIIVQAPGTYSLEVIDIYTGCIDIATINITEDYIIPTVNISASSPEINAQNPTVDLTANATVQGTASYVWSNVSLSNPTTVSSAGTYTVTVTDDDNGCTATASITITENFTDIYVDYTATGTNDGSSWANAFTDLQDALATGGGTIHIAKGTYYPTSGTIRGVAYEMSSNTTILGGYPNGGGTRAPSSNETILSGNIDGVASYAGNSYHVVSVKNVNDVILDGLTIRDGNADNANSFGRSRGGGLFVNNATLTLNNVEVKWNKAIYGAGMFATLSPNVTLEDCTFKKNTANNGSAIYHSNQTNLYIDKTRIIDNNSLGRCAIEVNNSLYTKIENSVIANNASSNANAIAFIATNRDGSCDIYNTTILGETKNKFLITMQVGYGDQLDLSLYNSIVAHQDPAFTQAFKGFNNGTLNLNTSNCYIQGSTVEGNAMNNLYSVTAGDLMLNSDYSLNPCSPGVDDGSNAYVQGNTDINGIVRVINTVDIGAYENILVCRPATKEKEGLAPLEILVFPNPTKDQISIQTNLENPRFYLFDLLGKEILKTNKKEINLGNLSQGIYLLRIMDGNELVESVKVIKD